jgi:transcriptional regulator with XRE-family HTH domain
MNQRDINQRDLSKRLKVTPAVISRILRHPTRSKLETLSRLARALDVPSVNSSDRTTDILPVPPAPHRCPSVKISG